MPIPSFNLSDLTGSNGFTINGVSPYDTSGYFVSGAGDINGDGIDDVIIGAPGFNGKNPDATTSPGSSYVVFGKQGGFDPTLNLSDLTGTNGFTIEGIAAGNQTGVSVSSAGDINGDGIDDVIIGALYADPNGLDKAGVGYVVFGQQGGFSDKFDLNTLDGTNGFTIEGIAEGNETGVTVSGIGDFNGDGIADLIIGSPFADPNGIYSGSSYVVFGSQAGFAPTLNLSTLDGTNGFAINGANEYALSGKVSDAGDINGDGFKDVIIGAYGANDFAGTSFVLFGSEQPFSPSFNLSQINGTNGFAINGIAGGDYSGFSVSSAGDFNGDGFGDVIIGAPVADTVAGQSYIVFGKEGGFSASLNLSELDGTNGFALNGVNAFDFSGISVSAAGDINGDGLDDVIIGASYADPSGRTNAGSSYVIYGRTPIIGTKGKDSLYGTVSDDTIYGRGGNDTIYGGEGVNTLFGEDGNDLLYGGSQVDYIYGGKGNDRIFGAEGNNKLFGDAGNDTIYSASGKDWIDGGSGNDTIWLGGGQDKVVLASGNGIDKINNFQVGQALIALSGGLTFGSLNIVQDGKNTLIEIADSGEDLARLNGVQASTINSSSFVSV
jgi:Ca2+-binding RTX toxin-like protein